MNDLVAQLRALAGDFETLADPARDDRDHIYKWKPPSWYGSGFFALDPVKGARCIEIAATLEEAARLLEG